MSFHSQATQRRRRNRIEKSQNENRGETEDLCISEEDNRMLIAPYNGEEIRKALFPIESTKALGDDGFPALFYQGCWPIIGNDVVAFCFHLLNGDIEITFFLGRLISDNVLLAYKILYLLKQKRLGKKGFIAVKLDMSKAYDKVEWNFVGEIMNRMGFA
ncbi:uncharacterized protein [Gossypium hirsutum]|uniref:Reverse transcriptase n=1 Tax=Gossypium hirsutum TaxID=3635 RepID=A0ABM3BJH0_GOSHI|nr:uncharacterized protein LOC121228094 [Gossypium hirsutum]